MSDPARMALLALALCALFSCADMRRDVPAIPDDIRDSAQARVDHGWNHALVIGVIGPGGRSYLTEGDAEPSTLFELGSMTKVFTGLLLADFIREGEIALDDEIDLRRLCPGLDRIVGPPLLFETLATHRSGLPRAPANLLAAPGDDPYANYGRAELCTALAQLDPAARGPERYRYSNFGYVVLAEALADLGGLGFEELLAERVGRRSGLDDTAIYLSAEQRSRLAASFDLDAPRAHWHHELPGAGGLHSTADDLLTLLGQHLGLFESDLAPLAAIAETPRYVAPNAQVSVGLGWHVEGDAERTIVWQNGRTGGHNGFLGYSRALSRGVVVLASGTGAVDDIGLCLLDPRRTLRSRPEEVPLVAEELHAYEGRYLLPSGNHYELSVRRGRLFITSSTSSLPAALFSLGGDRFHVPLVETGLRLGRGPDGEVRQLVIEDPGLVAERVEHP